MFRLPRLVTRVAARVSDFDRYRYEVTIDSDGDHHIDGVYYTLRTRWIRSDQGSLRVKTRVWQSWGTSAHPHIFLQKMMAR